MAPANRGFRRATHSRLDSERSVTKQDNRASDLVEGIKAAFSERLRAQFRKKGVSISRLAEDSGISRSVLSGYLSDDTALPNAVNLVRLARALDCEPGVFLPSLASGSEGGMITDVTQLSHAMVPDDRMREMLDAISSAQGEFIYYVPSTIPEPIKTDAVFEFEYAATDNGNLRSYIEAMRSMLTMPLNGGLLIDEVLLLDLAHTRGIYRGLAPSAAEEQLHNLLTFSGERFPQWQIKVIRRLEARINPCFVVGESLLLQEFFAYIIHIQNRKVITGVQGRLNEVFRQGTDFIHWHETHLGHAATERGTPFAETG
jgi:transcriptional regulator with XRE-family HTH domain